MYCIENLSMWLKKEKRKKETLIIRSYGCIVKHKFPADVSDDFLL